MTKPTNVAMLVTLALLARAVRGVPVYDARAPETRKAEWRHVVQQLDEAWGDGTVPSPSPSPADVDTDASLLFDETVVATSFVTSVSHALSRAWEVVLAWSRIPLRRQFAMTGTVVSGMALEPWGLDFYMRYVDPASPFGPESIDSFIAHAPQKSIGHEQSQGTPGQSTHVAMAPDPTAADEWASLSKARFLKQGVADAPAIPPLDTEVPVAKKIILETADSYRSTATEAPPPSDAADAVVPAVAAAEGSAAEGE